jgi:hypothetical protein
MTDQLAPDIPAAPPEADRPGPLARWVIHPILIAAFPVVSLCASNIELRPIRSFTEPLVAVVFLTCLLTGLFWLVFRDLRRAGFASSILVFLFFAYGPFYNSVRGNMLFGVVVGRDRYLMPLVTVLVLSTVLYAWRAKGGIAVCTVLLNVMAVSILALPVATVVSFTMREKERAPRTSDEPYRELFDMPGVADRDIYYIVPDRYQGSKTLEKYFRFKNARFEAFLSKKGFYVARDALANYPRTSFSVPAALNMEYVNWLGDKLGTDSRDLKPLLSLLQEHRVGRILKRMGYSYVQIGSHWQPTASNVMADKEYRYAYANDASLALILNTFAFRANKHFGLLDDYLDPWRIYWHSTPRQFKRLKEVASMKEPTFTFAHFLLPHPPFIFDGHGRYITRPESKKRALSRLVTEQVTYTNKKLMGLIDHLLDVPEDKQPIIIIQADEGQIPPGLGHKSWRGATDRQLEYKFRIMSAFYFPGVDQSKMYPRISNANAFRLLFDLYYGADLEILEDRSYVSEGRLYELTDVTRRIRREGRRNPPQSESIRKTCPSSENANSSPSPSSPNDTSCGTSGPR